MKRACANAFEFYITVQLFGFWLDRENLFVTC